MAVVGGVGDGDHSGAAAAADGKLADLSTMTSHLFLFFYVLMQLLLPS